MTYNNDTIIEAYMLQVLKEDVDGKKYPGTAIEARGKNLYNPAKESEQISKNLKTPSTNVLLKRLMSMQVRD